MLRPHDITSLIRDADDSEAVLFTLAQTNAVAKVAAAAELIKTANIPSNLDPSSGSPSRPTKQQSTNGATANSYNVEMLCDTVETISQTYPMSGITESSKSIENDTPYYVKASESLIRLLKLNENKSRFYPMN